MPVMIQVRNVPDELHRKLKARAAMAGMSLSAYLLGELEASASKLTMEEFRARLATREPFDGDLDVVQILREEREAR